MTGLLPIVPTITAVLADGAALLRSGLTPETLDVGLKVGNGAEHARPIAFVHAECGRLLVLEQGEGVGRRRFRNDVGREAETGAGVCGGRGHKDGQRDEGRMAEELHAKNLRVGNDSK